MPNLIKKSITDNTLKILAKTFRKDIFIFKTNSGFGHLASSLSCVDILVSLFFDLYVVKFSFTVIKASFKLLNMYGISKIENNIYQ